MNTVDALAGGVFLDWEAVMMRPLSDCYVKMKLNHRKAVYQKALSNIMRNKR